MLAMKILKKQCQDLLLPNCEIKVSTKVGEGIYVCTYVGVYCYMLTPYMEC